MPTSILGVPPLHLILCSETTLAVCPAKCGGCKGFTDKTGDSIDILKCIKERDKILFFFHFGFEVLLKCNIFEINVMQIYVSLVKNFDDGMETRE